MDSTELKNHLEGLLPNAQFPENKQYPEIIVPLDKLHTFCQTLNALPNLQFDYLISLTAVDWKDHFMMVYHIASVKFRHVLIVKARIDERENPAVDTLSDIWKTAEYHEREVFDLFGISFNNHCDLRRLFLEDGYGFPLRKDFVDELRMIVK